MSEARNKYQELHPIQSTSLSNLFASTISNQINNREKITNETLMNSEITSPNNSSNNKTSPNVSQFSNTLKTMSIHTA